MTNLVPLPDRESVSGQIAGEVRAELSRARIKISHLPRLLGKSNAYWSRRAHGETALDVEDLAALAGLLGVPITRFFRALSDAPGPDGPVGPPGLEPGTYGLQVRTFESVAEVVQLPRRDAEIIPFRRAG